MRKILIATTNPGKFREIVTELSDLPFMFVNLHDVGLDKQIVDEPFSTTWENALHKAKFFAHKSKLLTIAEDSGFFIDHLHGAPGVRTKEDAPTESERIDKILHALRGVRASKRGAYFQTHACIYDPSKNSFTIFEGMLHGRVAEKAASQWPQGMEHDAIFFYPPARKLLADMSPLEKNLISQRGQIAISLKLFLQRTFTFRQIVVPIALIVKDRKMLMNKRRDSRPDFNNTWEFPGGAVENGEDIEETLKRECAEETGYRVRIIERLPQIFSITMKDAYQIFVVGYICNIQSGSYRAANAEVSDHGWFTYNEMTKMNLLSKNKNFIQTHRILIKKYID